MPADLPLTSFISQTSSDEVSYRIIEVQYGNGYSQRAKDGINARMESWTVNYDNITKEQFNTLVNAFDAAAGVDYFYWQAPTSSSVKKYVIQKFTESALAGEIYSVAVTLKEDPNAL